MKFNPEKFSPETEKEPKPHLNLAIVFGAGPIQKTEQDPVDFTEKEKLLETLNKDFLETEQEKKEYQQWTKQTREMLPIPAKMRAIAALEILNKGEVNEVIISGGKTGGEELPSEAELMRDYIIRKKQIELNKKVEKEEISEGQAKEILQEMIEKIKMEESATNTIENFANIINMIDENSQQYQDIGFLSNQFHLDRTVKLAEKFQLKGEKLSGEKELDKRSKHYKKFLDKACSIENKEYEKILQGEEKWTKALEELPMYWFPQATLVNQERLTQMLEANKELEKTLKKKGLTLEDLLNMSPEEKRAIRDMPS